MSEPTYEQVDKELLVKAIMEIALDPLSAAGRACAYLKERIAELEDENAALKALNESLAARVAAQSELLTRKAEKP